MKYINSDGTVANSYSYDPFGKMMEVEESKRNIFKYIGRYGIMKVDELDDVYMMRSREYDANHGRYMLPDPIGKCFNEVITFHRDFK